MVIVDREEEAVYVDSFVVPKTRCLSLEFETKFRIIEFSPPIRVL